MSRPPLRIPTNGKPTTSLQQGALDGAIDGEIAGDMIGGPVGQVVGMVGGGFLGGIFGKQQHDEELRTGWKMIDPPTYFNQGLAVGLFLGGMTALVIGFATGGMLAPLLVAGMMFAGGAMGSLVEKSNQEVEYTKAEDWQRQNAASERTAPPNKTAAPAYSRAPSITPEVVPNLAVTSQSRQR